MRTVPLLTEHGRRVNKALRVPRETGVKHLAWSAGDALGLKIGDCRRGDPHRLARLIDRKGNLASDSASRHLSLPPFRPLSASANFVRGGVRPERWLAESGQDQNRTRWKKLSDCKPLRALTGCGPKKQPASSC
jgi:hypothetical protein